MEEDLPAHGNYMENFDDSRKGKQFPGIVQRWSLTESGADFICKDTILRLEIVSDTIIRFRYAIDGIFEPDFSYALDPAYQREFCTFQVYREDEKVVELETKQLLVKIQKSDLKTTISNQEGLVLLEDELGYHWESLKEYSGNVVICTKKLSAGEHFYGLGDKPSNLNLRGSRKQMWGSDTYAYGPETDPIYKNIPFYIGLHHKVAYGIFLDNTFRSWFDFGSERANVSSFWAQGGEMNYYFIYGPQALDVSRQYTKMTGTPELPPLWALGYQQSKWSYYPEKTVRNLAAEFRKRQIPCDVIHLDIDYMDGYRCFTWDKQHFPDPAKMISDLRKDGFKTICIIDPGIKVDEGYDVYDDGLQKDVYCRTADGPYYRGSVWPGICNFPDFTRPDVRTWWEDLYKSLMDVGVDGVWNDMNEPATFETGTFPPDIRFDYDGHPCSHRKAHNIYGMQMSRATFDGVKKHGGGKRAFVLTRSTYSGGQRYASGWTGDNIANWEHITVANVQCQRLSISGFSYVGSDVGGFVETPSPELYVRWVQLALFHPFLRTHSSGDHGAQEPWSFGPEAEDIVRRMLTLRYRLLPYIYTAFWQYSQFGTPMLRPLFMLNQRDADTHYRQDEFGLGDHLISCPITQPGVSGRWLYLPEGYWFDFWTDELIDSAGEEVWCECGMERFPLYIKAGAVLPMGPPQQYVGEVKTKSLDLHLYLGKTEEVSLLYTDAGDGYGYQNEEKVLASFTFSPVEGGYRLVQEREGAFTPEYTTYTLHLHGMPHAKLSVKLGESPIQAKGDNDRTYQDIPNTFDEIFIQNGS
jgi:alpha-glucosidase